MSPERMVYEKMLGLEGPEPYDPVMRSLFFTVVGGRQMDSGTGATYVKRGLRGALHHKEDIQELSARFGDQLLPGLPVTSFDARIGVAELAALDACEAPLPLQIGRVPGSICIGLGTLAEVDPYPSTMFTMVFGTMSVNKGCM